MKRTIFILFACFSSPSVYGTYQAKSEPEAKVKIVQVETEKERPAQR